MKKTCHGCKALSHGNSFYSSGYYCSLYFLNREDFNGKVFPIEECPKPRTTKEFISEYRKINERIK